MRFLKALAAQLETPEAKAEFGAAAQHVLNVARPVATTAASGFNPTLGLLVAGLFQLVGQVVAHEFEPGPAVP